MKAAIIGGGVIGGGWAARFLLNGWDVAFFDPDPQSERKIGEVLANARRSLPSLYSRAMPEEGDLRSCPSIAEAVRDVDWVQESAPERLAVKHEVLRDIQQHAPASALIGSSTSGFKPSDLQEGARRAEQILVCHPFNPVYLLPLVEVVPSAANPKDVVARCNDILAGLGMKPLVVRKEVDAHLADRLLEALWREALWLVHDDVATTEEIDEAIRLGFGLRWAQMGLFETYRIAGGEAGMHHFIGQFGPALQSPWSRLTDVPDLTDHLIDKIARQSDAQSGHRSIRELERVRDDNLVAILRALKKNGWGVGEILGTHEPDLPAKPATTDGLVLTADRQVPPSWTDYNDHMNETHYLEAFTEATDRLMEIVGADSNYVASGRSYFTVESHLRHLGEIKTGERIRITTQVLDGAGKKMHLFHRMLTDDGDLVATGEHLLLHVDLGTRRSCPPEAEVAQRLLELAALHAAMPVPDGAGRAVGKRDDRD